MDIQENIETIEKAMLEIYDMVDTLSQALKELQYEVKDLEQDFDRACSDAYGFITGDF